MKRTERVEVPLQKVLEPKRSLVDKTMIAKKYRSHMNFHNARKQKTIQSPFENIRCKVDPEISTKKSFYYLDPRAKDPLQMRSSLL